MNPEDYWGTLLLGGCYTWSGSSSVGEPYIRRAITIDPVCAIHFLFVIILMSQSSKTIPNGYTLLAQNLMWQGRGAESIPIVESMICNHTFPSVFNEPDRAAKIIEALQCMKNAGGTTQRYRQTIAIACNKYPLLASKINQLL